MEHTVYMDKQRRSYIALGLVGKRQQDCSLLTLKGGQVSVIRLPANMLGHIGLTPYAATAQHAAEVYARSELSKTQQAVEALRTILGAEHVALRGVTSIDSELTEVVQMHYIFSKNGEFLSAHKNAKEANSILGKLPEDARAASVIVAEAAGLTQFTLAQIAAVFNAHTAEAERVGKLKDKTTGTEAAFNALQATFDPAVIKAAEKDAKDAAKTAEKEAKAKAKADAAAVKAADKAAKVAAGGGEKAERAPRVGYAGKAITVLNAVHGARAGTKRATGMEILIASKTTDEALEAFKAHPGIDASFIRYAVGAGIIALA